MRSHSTGLNMVSWEKTKALFSKTYLSGFDLVPCGTAPALQIGKNFAFLPVKARVHLTPPLLLHYRGWWRDLMVEEANSQKYKPALNVSTTTNTKIQDLFPDKFRKLWSNALLRNVIYPGPHQNRMGSIFWAESSPPCKVHRSLFSCFSCHI